MASTVGLSHPSESLTASGRRRHEGEDSHHHWAGSEMSKGELVGVLGVSSIEKIIRPDVGETTYQRSEMNEGIDERSQRNTENKRRLSQSARPSRCSSSSNQRHSENGSLIALLVCDCDDGGVVMPNSIAYRSSTLNDNSSATINGIDDRRRVVRSCMLSLIETNYFKELTHLSLRFYSVDDQGMKQHLGLRLNQWRVSWMVRLGIQVFGCYEVLFVDHDLNYSRRYM